LEAGADVHAVTQLIADLDDTLSVTLLRWAEARLGPPPCPYAWLVLGSGGRREQALLSDQDNAIVYGDAGHDGGRAAVTAYFTALAEAVVASLEAAGFPPCQGGCTARRWQHSLAEWGRIFRDWVERPEPAALVQAEVFLDFRRVYGSVSPDPLDDILRTGAEHPRFLVQMARAAVTFVPPLGLFRRVKTDHHHEVDLKRAGIAAIVLLARFYALAAGSVARPTPARLAAAVSGGMLSHGGGERLAQHYRFLTDLRLRNQLRQVEAGGRPDNRLVLAEVPPGDRRRLGEALRAIREIQQTTALQFQTDTVT
jgi:CBS domain-containing protein